MLTLILAGSLAGSLYVNYKLIKSKLKGKRK